MMIRRLGKLLKIREGEGAKVFQFAMLAALLDAGLTVGGNAADALFLTHVGADKLPVIYIITPAMMLLYVPTFSYLVSRWGIDRLFNTILGTIVVCGFLFAAAISSIPLLPNWLTVGGGIFYLVKLYAVLWFVALYTLLWSFIDAYFDILDAKRLFALFSGGAACGAIAGGALVTLCVRFLNVGMLFAVWSLLAAATFPVVSRLRSRWKKIPAGDGDGGETRTDLRSQRHDVLQAVSHSRYVNLLIPTFFIVLLLSTLCDFECMRVFQQGRTEPQVAALLGRLFVLANVFNLVVDFLLFNRLVIWIGVRNVTLVQPVVYALAFSFFTLKNGLAAAAFGFFAYQGFLLSIEVNNQNFLFNALPERGKVPIRTFVEGLCEPMATAVTGVLLLFAVPRWSPESLSLAGLTVALLMFCVALGLRAEYVRAMLFNLKARWLDFSRVPRVSPAGRDHGEEEALDAAARSGTGPLPLLSIRMLGETNRMAALGHLLAFLERSETEDQRAAAPVLAALLKEEDGDVIRLALIWLGQTRARLDGAILGVLGHHGLLSPDEIEQLARARSPDNRAAAALALWNSWKPDDNLRSMQLLHNLMAGTPDEQLAAIGTMGKSEYPRYAHYLVRYLADPSASIRKQALASMFDLIDEEAERLLGDFLAVVRRGDRAERLIGLDALARIGSVDSIRPLVTMSDRLTPFERRRVQLILIGIGLESVPILTAILREPGCPLAGKSMAARALAKLSFPQMESLAPELVDREIRAAYGLLCAHQVLSRQDGRSLPLQVLSRFLRDSQAATVNLVLETLTITGQLPDFEMMASSLRSRNPKARANALETIEQGCTRRTFRLFLPLIDARPWDEAAAFYCDTYGTELPSFWQMLLGVCESADPLGAAAGMLALMQGEESSAGPPAEITEALSRRIHDRLLDPRSDGAADTIFSHLARRHMPGSPLALRLNMVERAHLLWSTDFFRPVGADSIQVIARQAGERDLAPGCVVHLRGETCEQICVVVKGGLEIDTGDGERTAGPGSVLGTESLLGVGGCESGAISKGATVLEIPRKALLEAAETFPDLALYLLGRKLAAEREEGTA